MTVHADVVLKVRVRAKSRWSDETTMKQIREQATIDAEGALNRLFAREPSMRLLETLNVVAVSTNDTNDLLS